MDILWWPTLDRCIVVDFDPQTWIFSIQMLVLPEKNLPAPVVKKSEAPANFTAPSNVQFYLMGDHLIGSSPRYT
jgi:hypothetical protein